jgi:hypothetical protein
MEKPRDMQRNLPNLLLSGLVTLLLAMLIPMPSRAQVGSADVLGTVTDTTGAVIPGATITVKNLGTSIVRTTTSGASGEYIVNTLPNGSYSLTAEAKGFKTFTIKEFALTTGERARKNAQLTIGDVTERVEVAESSTATLQTDTATVTSTIDSTAVQELPMGNRNFYGIVQELPGVNFGNQGGSSSGGGSGTSGTTQKDRRPDSTIMANGQSDGSNNNMVNGFDNNGDVIFGNTGVRPTVDGIEEMKVDTGNGGAEDGRAAGAAVNVVTKSGTNNFHGSAFEYLRNEATDARNFFDTVAVDPKIAKYRQNNFGGSVGGPIKKGKTFFFFAYENDQLDRGLTFTSFVPTAYELDHIGDFSDVPGNFCGAGPNATGDACSSSNGPLHGPIINGASGAPDGMLPWLVKMYSLFPKANAGESNGVGKYVTSPDWTQRITDWEVRIDHHFSPNDTVFVRYANNPAATTYPGNFPEKDGVEPNGEGLEQPGVSSTPTKNVQVDYVHIFTPQLLIDLKAGFSRYNSQDSGFNQGKGLMEAFGIPNAVSKGAIGDDLPELAGPFELWSAMAGPSAVPLHNIGNTFQYAGSATYNHGTHDVKVGGGFIRRQVQYFTSGMYGGLALMGFPFGPYNDSRAAFLGGYPLFFQRNNPIGIPNGRGSEWNLYAQDNWRVTSRITINYGVRYDVFTVYGDAHNVMSNFDIRTLGDGKALDAHNFILGGTGGLTTDYGSIAPRVGVSYSMTPKTVIRGAFGISYSPSGTGALTNQNPPYVFNNQNMFPWLGADPATDPGMTIWENIPTKALSLDGWNNLSYITSVSNVPLQPKNPRTFQSNITLQRQIGNNSVSAGWVGVFGRDGSLGLNLNVPNMPGANGAYTGYIYTQSPSNPNGIFNYVTGISSSYYGKGISNYDALQLVFARHLTNGLSANANWTWSHALATSAGPNNYSTEYGNSGLDIRHRMAANATYAIPFARNAHGVLAVAAKGWQATGIWQWQTGNPWQAQTQVGCSITGTSADARGCGLNNSGVNQSYLGQPGSPSYRPNIVGKPMVNGKANYAAFQPPVFGTQGNEGLNSLLGPHYREFDMSLIKDFQVHDQIKLQFRAEAFNISNTPNFSITSDNISVSAWTNDPTQGGGVSSANPSGLVAVNDAKLGQLNDTAGFSTARNFQFVLKLLF